VNDAAERPREDCEPTAHSRSLLVGQFVQRASVPSENEDEPQGNDDGMTVLDTPVIVELVPRTLRQHDLTSQ
jgi:hypothetical protein